MSRDCIVGLRAHILDGGFADETQLGLIDDNCLTAVQEATEFANNSPFPEAGELLEDVYVSY